MSSISPRAAPTQVRCAAGSRSVSPRMRGRGGAGGALAGRPAGAVGPRDEIWFERLQAIDRFPQAVLHLGGLRREELKGNGRLVRRPRSGVGHFAHDFRVSSFQIRETSSLARRLFRNGSRQGYEKGFTAYSPPTVGIGPFAAIGAARPL